MIKCCDQLDLARQQHTVAKHVACHIADPGDREWIFLRIQAHFAEMARDGYPGAAGRNAHLLVVIAGRTTRCERVVKPKAVICRYAVRDIGKGRGTFIGGDDKVRIIAVASYNTVGRYDLAIDNVVRDIEQSTDECLVAMNTVLHDCIRITNRRALRKEAAFCTGWDDDCVLDDLRLHQTQHFGSKVLATVRPAQTTPRNVSAT